MDVVFLHSNELNWQQNFEIAQDIIEQPIIIVDGSTATSIKNAYEIMLSNVTQDYFMMLEADNIIYPEIKKYLKINEELKFFTVNKFNIAYEHGGIKIMNASKCEKHFKTNANIHPNFEVSANLSLKSCNEIMSYHQFEWSNKNEWTTIAKELIKLYYWNQDYRLKEWLSHETPKLIFKQLEPFLQTLGFSELFETFLPSLNKMYVE